MLRKAKQEDRNKWVRLNREFMDFEIQDDNLWGHIDTSKDEELADIFDQAMEKPEYITLFMIEENGETIGFANLMTIFSVWSEGHALIIDDLYIISDHQGKGLGRRVMEEIEDYARKGVYKRLQFQSEETNPGAKAFYTKLGYEPIAMSFYARYL